MMPKMRLFSFNVLNRCMIGYVQSCITRELRNFPESTLLKKKGVDLETGDMRSDSRKLILKKNTLK